MAERPAANPDHRAPETIEGWYVLHDAWHIDWPAWRGLEAETRTALTTGLADWLDCQADQGGGTACYRVVTQKADLLLLHYRESPTELQALETALRHLPIFDYLRPAGGYLSVIEASLYEATGRAHGILARQGLNPTSEGWEEAFASEIAKQKQHLEERVRKPIPAHSHVCYYPMSKRRGEQVNWYDTPLEERRKLMRGHGALGAKYVDRLTQVISGSVGLDDWEWAVDLHCDDPLQFKKLIYDMRFDPASSRYALFGEFWIGMKTAADELRAFLTL